jgi:dolichol-phosphate mannosyltransferase
MDGARVSAKRRPQLSIVIPAHNEEQSISETVGDLTQALERAAIDYEVIIVNDNSSDSTGAVVDALAAANSAIQIVHRSSIGGFGRAVRAGLQAFTGEAVAIVMADCSDDPEDVVRCYRKLEEGYDCVFGSRFQRQSKITGYPMGKLIVNRIVNKGIQLLFWTSLNDLTNAFKVYRREVVEACGPYSSSHFNLTIEMSLSALIRRYHIAEIPINWYGRSWGASKLSIAQMGRRYLSVLLKLFFDRILIGDDIFEERLAAGEVADHRLRSLEKRLDDVETSMSTMRGLDTSDPSREDGCDD